MFGPYPGGGIQFLNGNYQTEAYLGPSWEGTATSQ